MGQGAEDAGGYDPWEEGLETGHWTQRDYSKIHVSVMSESHIRNTIRLCERIKLAETLECEMDKWQEWIDLFNRELASRIPTIKPYETLDPPGVKLECTKRMKCHCGTVYDARVADLNRGWALSCSKRCAAIRREFGRPAGKEIKDESSSNQRNPREEYGTQP